MRLTRVNCALQQRRRGAENAARHGRDGLPLLVTPREYASQATIYTELSLLFKKTECK